MAEQSLSGFLSHDSIEKNWDIKSPVSPPPGANWTFDANHQLKKIKKSFCRKDKLIVNLINCNKDDSAALINLLKEHLSDNERKRTAILLNRKQTQNS